MNFEWLYDGVAVDFDVVVVEVPDVLLEAHDGLLESDPEVHVEVVAFPGEEGVSFLDDGEDEVSGHVVGVLLAFALEDDVLAVGHSSLDVDLEVLLLADDLEGA